LLFVEFSSQRVFSAYIKEVDEKAAPSNWGAKTTFANLLGEYSSDGGKLFCCIRVPLSGIASYDGGNLKAST